MNKEILTMDLEDDVELEIDLNENRIDPYIQIEHIELVETPRAVDDEMSDESENPVQNKVVKEYIDARTDKHHIHTQISASDHWVIAHGLNKYPAITVVDSGGTVVIGEVEYIDMNVVYIKFNGIFSGKAYCN